MLLSYDRCSCHAVLASSLSSSFHGHFAHFVNLFVSPACTVGTLFLEGSACELFVFYRSSWPHSPLRAQGYL